MISQSVALSVDVCPAKKHLKIDLLRQGGDGFSLFRENAEFSQPLLGI